MSQPSTRMNCALPCLIAAGTVRAIAQFYLSKSAALNVPGFYREAVMRGSAGEPASGIRRSWRDRQGPRTPSCLPRRSARHASRCVRRRWQRLASWLDARVSTCLSSLMRCKTPVAQASADKARLALERCVREVGSERLSAVFFGSPHLHVQRQALALINRLPKWQRVTLLVEILGRAKPEDGITRMADNFLRDWISGYNRNHEVLPSKLELAHLAAALARHRAGMDARLWQSLQGHISFMS